MKLQSPFLQSLACFINDLSKSGTGIKSNALDRLYQCIELCVTGRGSLFCLWEKELMSLMTSHSWRRLFFVN